MVQKPVVGPSLLAAPVAKSVSEHVVPTTVRDGTKSLDIDVEKFAWRSLLVTGPLLLPLWGARDQVDMDEQRHLVAGKHRASRRVWHMQVETDPVSSPSTGESERDDTSRQTR